MASSIFIGWFGGIQYSTSGSTVTFDGDIAADGLTITDVGASSAGVTTIGADQFQRWGMSLLSSTDIAEANRISTVAIGGRIPGSSASFATIGLFNHAGAGDFVLADEMVSLVGMTGSAGTGGQFQVQTYNGTTLVGAMRLDQAQRAYFAADVSLTAGPLVLADDYQIQWEADTTSIEGRNNGASSRMIFRLNSAASLNLTVADVKTHSTNGLTVRNVADNANCPVTALSITTSATDFLHTTSAALANGAGAQTATMTNGPTAGNPTKWIPINDNGTTRYVPAW